MNLFVLKVYDVVNYCMMRRGWLGAFVFAPGSFVSYTDQIPLRPLSLYLFAQWPLQLMSNKSWENWKRVCSEMDYGMVIFCLLIKSTSALFRTWKYIALVFAGGCCWALFCLDLDHSVLHSLCHTNHPALTPVPPLQLMWKRAGVTL